MQALKAKFRDVGGLHARIDTYTARSSVLRIGLVTRIGRKRAAPVLNALIAEPVQRTLWADAVARRPMSKDVLVEQSSSFEFVETHNSLVVYPVPFPGPAVEYLEAVPESFEHLKSCHVLADIRDIRDITVDYVEKFPHIILHDGNAPVPPTTHEDDPSSICLGVVETDSKSAVDGAELLQQSPSNASTYLAMRNASGIDTLREKLMDRTAVQTALRESIFAACQRQITSVISQRQPQLAAQAAELRAEWAQLAHSELQGTLLPAVRALLAYDLAFWKLYFRADDVTTDVSLVLGQRMRRSRAAYDYLRGSLRADQNGSQTYKAHAYHQNIPEPEIIPELETALTCLQQQATTGVIEALTVQLPLATAAVVGVYFAALSPFAMGSLAALGVVVGLRRLQTRWLRACRRFEAAVQDTGVNQIQIREQELWELGEQEDLGTDAHCMELERALEDARKDV